MIHRLVRQQDIPAPIEMVWAFFSDPNNLDALTPPEMKFQISHGGREEMFLGQLIEYKIEVIRGFRVRWLTEISHLKPFEYFVDEQRAGPYKFWYHEHHFRQVNKGVRMMDKVTYALPLSVLGNLVHRVWVQNRLNQIFDFRASIVEQSFGKWPEGEDF